ncbi:hypothetical protein K461DRAFT_288958 [Myriangium duriaei CBS 260.36]|uniref:Rhodopsin domain-containing protein n=1 Tax=Myriangium duriaei CBS 260.36 TaxID=1168546 RepID=A0A9P4MNU4_9PEZI|nr:hypothetical protein K461DRAFT_288958 [Myriangium duriaei CBS 260.36]
MASTVGFFNSSALQGPANETFIEPATLLIQETNGFFALAAVFLPLCWVAVGLRVYVRTVVIKNFGADDWAMMVTMLLFTSLGVLLCVIAAGIQRHAVPLGAGMTPTSDSFAKLITIGYCLYSATMISFKLSLGFFFLKIFVFRTGYIITIWLTIVLPTLLGVANIIYTGFAACNLESLFFIGLNNCNGYAQSQGWLDIAEAWTVVSTFTDILYAVLAVLAIVNMKMQRKNKITAAVLCALGSVGCVASCVRLAFFVVDFPVYSVLGESMMETMWTLIEPGLGIIAACLATLRPLFKALAEHTARAHSSARANSIAPRLPGSQEPSRQGHSAASKEEEELIRSVKSQVSATIEERNVSRDTIDLEAQPRS